MCCRVKKPATVMPSHTPPLRHSVSWVDQSAVKRTIKKYSGELDDFDLL